MFTTTSASKTEVASIQYGNDAYILGAKVLSGAISLNNTGETIKLSVNNNMSATVTLSKKNYANLSELITDINQQISSSGLKVKAEASGNKIKIVPTDSSVASINFGGDKGTAYTELFVGQTENYYSYDRTDRGETNKVQGSTQFQSFPAELTLDYAMRTGNTIVDSSNQTFKLTVDGTVKTVTLTAGSYTRTGLLNEINVQLRNQNIGVTASLTSGGKLKFTTVSTGENASLRISTGSGNTAMRAFMAPYISTQTPSIGTLQPAVVKGKTTVGSNFVIDGSNKDLKFKYTDKNGVQKSIDISLTEQTYANAATLAAALQSKIDSSTLGAGKIAVSVSTDGKNTIVMTTAEKGSVYFTGFSGGFYENVLCKKTTSTMVNTVTNTVGTTKLEST